MLRVVWLACSGGGTEIKEFDLSPRDRGVGPEVAQVPITASAAGLVKQSEKAEVKSSS